jgi:hypothetical protein
MYLDYNQQGHTLERPRRQGPEYDYAAGSAGQLDPLYRPRKYCSAHPLPPFLN